MLTPKSVKKSRTKINMAVSVGVQVPNDIDGFEFRFEPSVESHALRSVALVEGVPELRFDPSPNVPMITEEDVAIACRLALEGKRPEFFYIPIPPSHPFFGRQYKQYLPPWLKDTSIGKTLSEADWNMKCLNIGARSDEMKLSFRAWQSTSKLEGLATTLDFPQEKSSGSIIMSCESVKVEKNENELVFLGEPKLQICSEVSPSYSRYITRVLPNVAYHDEPLFLKLQEIFKLVLAAEWLKERGVKMSQNWVMEHTTEPTQTASQAVEVKGTASATHCSPEFEETSPACTQTDQPSSNVTMKRREARHCKRISNRKENAKCQYGWYDHGSLEMIRFEEDGTPCKRQHSLRTFTETYVSVNGQPAKATRLQLNFGIPLPPQPRPDDIIQLEKQLLSHSSHQEVTGVLGPISMDIEVDKTIEKNGMELKVGLEIQPCHPQSLPRLKITTVIRVSTDDYNMLYNGLDPNDPIRPEVPGLCDAVVPNVQSWNELFSETVPWPRIWQVPCDGRGECSAGGGVTTRSIPVTEERKAVSGKTDHFKKCCSPHIIRAQCGSSQGTIRLANVQEFAEVSTKFRSKWIKGTCPKVDYVFVVTNSALKQRWITYGRTLRDQTVEEHFHGTTLLCDITCTRALCTDHYCGICGISKFGLDRNYIRKNIDFQRFGEGFYLAPNSSKCHDYTQGAHGYRAMLLCDVCPGGKFPLEKTQQRLQGPPSGFDSVYGKVGRDLNYPEIVLYNPDAVMPRYIILYKKDGTNHPLALN